MTIPNRSIPIILLLFLLSIAVADSVAAQRMDTDALEKAQRGEVELAEGAFIAYLTDTITPEEARAGFEKAGLEISQLDISPVTIRVVNSPADSVMQRFLQHPAIRMVMTTRRGAMLEAVRAELERLGHSNEQISESMTRITMAGNSGRLAEYIIRFQYELDSDSVKQIMTGFRSIAYEVFTPSPRTATIKVSSGKESEAMEIANELPFVESTALIARLTE